MKVVFITHYTSLYGANRSLLNLIEGLRRHGVASCVVSPSKGKITQALRERDIPLAVIPMAWWMSECSSSDVISKCLRRKLGAAKRLILNVAILPALIKLFREWQVDVVYTNSSVIPVGALAAGVMQRPHVWHLREFGDLDYGLHPDWGGWLFRQVIGAADAQIAISQSIRSHFFGDLNDNKVHVIYNGVAWEADFDHLREQSKRYLSRHNRHYTFTLLGRIHPSKGQTTAIRALALVTERYPDARLMIVGGGEDSHLRRLISELGVAKNVELCGYIENPYEAYLAADASLTCSRNEAMGRVTAEAMAASRPVIGYDNAGTSEIVEHERTGLLYCGGPEALADCMMRFIGNPTWASQLGENGWQVARDKYSIETYSRRVYEVLQSI